MMKTSTNQRVLLTNYTKRFFAGGGKKKKKIDPKLKDFDVIFLGGLNSANMIKYFQHKHFHGTMAGFCHTDKFFYETLYPHMVVNDIKPFKYSSSNFSGNFDTGVSKSSKESISKIIPEKNQIVTEKGDTYTYKSLVLNTGLNQKSSNLPFLEPYINDEWAKTRVFVNDLNNPFQVSRNNRMFITHLDGDFIVYLPEGPNKLEGTGHWYLMLDYYFSRGQFTDNRSRSQRVKVITPNNHLLKFPFANEIVMNEIKNRNMIDVHFGMELVNVEVKPTHYGYERYAYFKDLATGQEVRMPFGSLLATPKNVKRNIYEGNDIADQDVT